MKKSILSTILLSGLAMLPLQADYQMTLIDKDGVQTNQCIKSYSFSNNLESISRGNSVGKDIYSENETLTNKVYLGKPVYRKVIKVDDVYGHSLGSFPDIDILVYDKINIRSKIDGSNTFSGYGGHNYYLDVRFNKQNSTIDIYSSFSKTWDYVGEVIIEYTKVTDATSSSINTFKSYLHYVPSLSSTEEVSTQDLENTGVRLLKDYTYDSSTNSCTPLN